jgi:hypothetical protein
MRIAEFGQDVEGIGTRIFIPASALAVSRVWMVISLWVALAGFAILAGILVRNGLSARLAGATAEPVT